VAQPVQAGEVSLSTKSSKSLLKLPSYDGSESLDTFLLKFKHLSTYLKWTEEDRCNHLCTS